MAFIGLYIGVVFVVLLIGRFLVPAIFAMSILGIVVSAAFSGIIGLVLVGNGVLSPVSVGATILGFVTAILIGRNRVLGDIDRRQSEN